MSKTSTKLISLWPLALLMTGTITSVRNFALNAKFGAELIFFFIAAAIVFLIPVALVAAELSSRWQDNGGIYFWSSKALGKGTGFLAIWLQWINTMAWYPAMLAFVGGLIAYMIDPTLATHKLFLISVILITFWSLTFINLFGARNSSVFAAICTIIGLILPMILIVSLGYLWVEEGKHLAIHISFSSAFPVWSNTQSWLSLTAIIASYVGMELATVHISQIKQPQKTLPRAIGIAVILIITSMIFGSLAIAFVVPPKSISLVTGVMQAFYRFFQAYHLTAIIPVLALVLFIGSIGGMINWIISPAKGLLQASQDKLISSYWNKTNKHQVAYRVLIAQAILVSFICVVFLLIPSIDGTYWLLVDLTTEMYLLMYAIMFIAAIVLFKNHYKNSKLTILKNHWLAYATCFIGLMGCCIALVVGFIPPKNIAVGGAAHYETIFIILLVIMIFPGLYKAIRTHQTK